MTDDKTFFDEIAEAIIATADVQKRMVGNSKVYMAHTKDLRAALTAAARMGAEGAVTLMPEHVPAPAMWVCSTCHLPVVLQDEDEDRSEWVHA
jgi:hypothetical protein